MTSERNFKKVIPLWLNFLLYRFFQSNIIPYSPIENYVTGHNL